MYTPEPTPSSNSNPAWDFISTAPVTSFLLITNVSVFALLQITSGGSDSTAVNLYRWGAKYGPAIQDGEWFRLIAPVFLHAGIFHLLLNIFALFIFGPRLERLFGPIAFSVTYMISGLFGVVASYWFYPALGVGASGAIFGIVGAYAIYLLINRQLLGEEARQMLVSLGMIIAINVVFGFLVAGIDQAAHMGGLAAGVVMAIAVSPRQVITVAENPFLTGPEDYITVVHQRRGFIRIATVTIIAIVLAVAITNYISNNTNYDAGTIRQYWQLQLLS